MSKKKKTETKDHRTEATALFQAKENQPKISVSLPHGELKDGRQVYFIEPVDAQKFLDDFRDAVMNSLQFTVK